MKTFVLAVLMMLGAGTVGTAVAADASAGAAKAKEVCQACHGMDGNSASPDYPKIGGQYPDYLSKALRDYKSGARKNPIMAGFAGTLIASRTSRTSPRTTRRSHRSSRPSTSRARARRGDRRGIASRGAADALVRTVHAIVVGGRRVRRPDQGAFGRLFCLASTPSVRVLCRYSHRSSMTHSGHFGLRASHT